MTLESWFYCILERYQRSKIRVCGGRYVKILKLYLSTSDTSLLKIIVKGRSGPCFGGMYVNSMQMAAYQNYKTSKLWEAATVDKDDEDIPKSTSVCFMVNFKISCHLVWFMRCDFNVPTRNPVSKRNWNCPEKQNILVLLHTNFQMKMFLLLLVQKLPIRI